MVKVTYKCHGLSLALFVRSSSRDRRRPYYRLFPLRFVPQSRVAALVIDGSSRRFLSSAIFLSSPIHLYLDGILLFLFRMVSCLSTLLSAERHVSLYLICSPLRLLLVCVHIFYIVFPSITTSSCHVRLISSPTSWLYNHQDIWS